jgi:outer membrane lipoprotein SlyB
LTLIIDIQTDTSCVKDHNSLFSQPSMKEKSMSDSNTPATTQGPRTAILAVGGVALVGLGLAAGMLLRSPSSAPIVESAAPVPVASAASVATEAASVASAAIPATAAVASAPAPVAAQAKPAAESRKAVRRQEAARQQTNTAPVGSTQPAQVCAHCGTVDSVRAVQQKGEGSGVGAVAGGVIGGVLGNQVGKGQGKTAMTILGAIGGGVAGNEIEKQQRAETVYEVTIRMDDGSYRTLTQRSAPPTGTRVEVEGNSLTQINR